MPSYKRVDTDAMIRAADSGQAGVRDAFARKQQAAEHAREMSLREGQSIADSINTHRAQTEQERSNKKREDMQQQELQESMRRNRVSEGLQQQELQEAGRRNRMGEAIEQDKQDIEMADRGLENKSGTSRADRLRSEMQRGAQQMQGQADPEKEASKQRYKEVADQSIEINGPENRTIAPTQERQDQEASKLTTNRLNAQANYLNATRSYHEAKMKGDTDGMAREMKSAENEIKSAAKLFDAGKKSALQPNQWEAVKQLAEGNPDPALQQEIETQTWGPRLSEFLQRRVSVSTLNYMAIDGDMPDGNLVDMASPMMQMFTASAQEMQGHLRAADAGGLLSQSLGVQSMADRNRLIRKLTARAMQEVFANPSHAAESGIIPSQGGASARQQLQQQTQSPGSAVNGKVGKQAPGPGGNPDLRTGSPVQNALRAREQRTIDEQTQRDQGERDQQARNRILRQPGLNRENYK